MRKAKTLAARKQDGAANSLYAVFFKRVADVVFAFLLGVPSLILLLPIMAAIKLESKGPVFFTQVRPGLQGRPFKLYKLRSMIPQNPPGEKQLGDMERVTRLGRLVRALSLDELPQLYNILRGDMSFIGPRPLLMQYLPLYTTEQARRHEVRPGISGWAQVNGRNALDWEEKFRLDVYYVDHISLVMDLGIFWKTLASVIKRQGINQSEGDTMQPFMGTESGEDHE